MVKLINQVQPPAVGRCQSLPVEQRVFHDDRGGCPKFFANDKAIRLVVTKLGLLAGTNIGLPSIFSAESCDQSLFKSIS